MDKLKPLAFGYAAAIVSAGFMLLLSIANYFGLYTGAMQAMQQWHMFYTPGVVGTITGMIEAAIISFAFVYVLIWVYNKLAKMK